jgi:hypothetical protein
MSRYWTACCSNSNHFPIIVHKANAEFPTCRASMVPMVCINELFSLFEIYRNQFHRWPPDLSALETYLLNRRLTSFGIFDNMPKPNPYPNIKSDIMPFCTHTSQTRQGFFHSTQNLKSGVSTHIFV